MTTMTTTEAKAAILEINKHLHALRAESLWTAGHEHRKKAMNICEQLYRHIEELEVSNADPVI